MPTLSTRHWFLSYHSLDQALAQRLEAALRRQAPGAEIFLSGKSLRVGDFWGPALAGAIAEASAFVLLVGAQGLGPWQAMEYHEALDRRAKQPGFPLILVLAAGQTAPGLPGIEQLPWLVSADPAAEVSVAPLVDTAAGKTGLGAGELWRHAAPYRGLAAMTEADAGFFFGRDTEIAAAIDALAAVPEKLLLLCGNSGVGKSSLARAGVLAALLRQGWLESDRVWPADLPDSRRWCPLTIRPGAEPVRALAEIFIDTWQFDATDPDWTTYRADWTADLLEGRAGLGDLMDATQTRYREGLQQPEPPGFLLYLDQGEELYTRAEPHPRRRFSEILAAGLTDRRLRAMASLRADFFGDFQQDEPLHAAHHLISVAPLPKAALRQVVEGPAARLGARLETGLLAGETTALPLISYCLDDLWARMIARGDGVLRPLTNPIDLDRLLADRAEAFVAAHAQAEDRLRRLFTLKLATLHPDREPMRRRAQRQEFSIEEWALVADLAEPPNRLLVTATAEDGTIYAELAHEAICRHWGRLRGWIASEHEFRAWKATLGKPGKAWLDAAEPAKPDALLKGAALAIAQTWHARRAADLPREARDFVERSLAHDQAAHRRARSRRMMASVSMLGLSLGLAGWLATEHATRRSDQHPAQTAAIPTPAPERALKPSESFRDCAKDCPEMVVIPPGTFRMGAAATEAGSHENEAPVHRVTIGRSFAVGKYDVTFAQWEICAAAGDCPRLADGETNRDAKPVVTIDWAGALQYAAWLTKTTGRPYRLLTEAEWEYAARAGTATAYFWGDEIGTGNADCNGCGSRWDGKQAAPVGSFAPNAFGLYDMAGNVYQWTADCYAEDYAEAPGDGSAVQTGACDRHVVRGGSWFTNAKYLRSANRDGYMTDGRNVILGFRVARTLP